MNIYLAGPMTGYDSYNVKAFREAAAKLTAEGHTVITPFDTNNVVWRRFHGRDFDPVNDKCDWGDPRLREMGVEDFTTLLRADAVYVLPGWTASKGAKAEVLVAQNFGVPVLSTETGTHVLTSVKAEVR